MFSVDTQSKYEIKGNETKNVKHLELISTNFCVLRLNHCEAHTSIRVYRTQNGKAGGL